MRWNLYVTLLVRPSVFRCQSICGVWVFVFVFVLRISSPVEHIQILFYYYCVVLFVFICLFVFQYRVSLYRLGCPGTCSADQTGLELTEIYLALPPEFWD